MGKRCVEQKVYWGSFGNVVVICKDHKCEVRTLRRINKNRCCMKRPCTHIYDEVLDGERPGEKRDIISKLVFVLVDGKRKNRNLNICIQTSGLNHSKHLE